MLLGGSISSQEAGDVQVTMRKIGQKAWVSEEVESGESNVETAETETCK
jgi:hypothetical protein